jgi:hypothetical protein
MYRLGIISICGFLSLFLSGCTSTTDPLRSVIGSYRNYTKVKGKIEAGRYYAPSNNFSCAVPFLIQPGAVIRDEVGPEGGTVAFEDDMGTLVRVDYFLIPSGGGIDSATAEGRKSLAETVFNFTVDRMYRAVVPDTKVLHKEYVQLQDGMRAEKNVALFAIALLPKGSSISEVKSGRYDALRASLIFVKGRYSYVLTIQDIPGLFDRRNVQLPEEERNKRLLSKLEGLHATCSFE